MSHASPVCVDLSSVELQMVRDILDAAGVTEANEPQLFGSRVTGQARRYSDIDLAFSGVAVSAAQLRSLRDAFEESSLPMTVDVLNLDDASPELRSHAMLTAVALGRAIGAT